MLDGIAFQLATLVSGEVTVPVRIRFRQVIPGSMLEDMPELVEYAPPEPSGIVHVPHVEGYQVMESGTLGSVRLDDAERTSYDVSLAALLDFPEGHVDIYELIP